MMKQKPVLIIVAIAGLIALHVGTVEAANINVTNVAIVAGAPAGETDVQCDISWDMSWHLSWTESGAWTNWDAVWVFVKYRAVGATSWSHGTLSADVSDHTVPTGAELEVGLTGSDGMGVFLHRSSEGSGSWTNTGVKLRWLYSDDGISTTDQVEVCVHAIEMVYVPEGAYDLGDGDGTDEAKYAFHVSGNTKVGQIGTTLVSDITCDVNGYDDIDSSAIGIDGDGGLDTDNDGTIDNADYPTGYKAFYCMKYEISQGQYADFLNQLSSADASTRGLGTTGSYRYSIGGSWPNYTSVVDRACNYLSWADGAAYADWSGLRPMTELEFEKACRGPISASQGEFAWGNTTIIATTSISDDATGTATANPVAANCNYASCVPDGTYRCGIYADASSDRTAAGATYWGIMEMSGSVWERSVTVGNSTGRAFTGLHGDGELSSGDADVANWPGTAATGAGFRSGAWNMSSNYLRASDRSYGAFTYAVRGGYYGVRVVRSAP